MQKTVLVGGWLTNEVGRTIDERVNEILDNNPDYRLTSITVLDHSETDCTLLCVLEKI